MECHEEGEGKELSATPRAVIQKAPRSKRPHNFSSTEGSKRRLLCTVETCGYSTPHSKDLARHMRKHTGERPFKCCQCEKSYSRADKLSLHVRLHQNKKLFACSTCDYTTVDNHSLTKHLRVHNGERPFKCQVCPYAAKESSQLVVHLRSHTGDCPYTCFTPYCSAAFKTLSDLKRHARLHSEEKPYSCPHCTHRSRVKSNLMSHIRSVHKDQLPADQSVLPPSKKRTKASSKATTIIMRDGTTQPTIPLLEAGVTEEQQYVCGGEYVSLLHHEEQEEDAEEEVDMKQLPVQMVILEEHSIHIPPKMASSSQDLEDEEIQETQLPFEFACKKCSFRAANYKSFAAHLKKSPKCDDQNQSQDFLAKTAPVKKPVGRPSLRGRRSGVGPQSGLETYFDCDYCTASFVRKDSLRCHVRQHSAILSSTTTGVTSGGGEVGGDRDPSYTPSESPSSFPTTEPQFLNFLNVTSSTSGASGSGGEGLFTSSYPNLNFHPATTTTTIIEPNIPRGTINVSVPSSVITENPFIPATSNRNQIFLVSSESLGSLPPQDADEKISRNSSSSVSSLH